MRIGVVGINYKLADLKLREQLAKACQRRFGVTQSIPGHHHFILLSTCNRTEVYFSSEDLATTHTYLLSILRNDIEEEFDHKLYSFFGVDCFSHLARVASGLDSAIVAETEIQGQVKAAYEVAASYHSLPKELHFLFQKALGISKKIRSELQLGRGMPSLEHAILNIGRHFFKIPEKARILFIGASEINCKILFYLRTKNLYQIMTDRAKSSDIRSMATRSLPMNADTSPPDVVGLASSYSSENDSAGFSHSTFWALTSSNAILTTTVTRYREATCAAVMLTGCVEIEVISPRTMPSAPSVVGTTV